MALVPCCLFVVACASWICLKRIFCSQVDLELDFLAPFLVKHGGVEAMTRKVALQVQATLFKTNFLCDKICENQIKEEVSLARIITF